jgi:predicted PurR-regulated permease PerM
MLNIPRAQRSRVVLLTITAILLGFLVIRARAVFFPFIIGAFLVYLFLPIVNFFDSRMPRLFCKWRISRTLAILITYLIVILLLVGFFAIFVPLMSEQISQLIELSTQYTLKVLGFTKDLNKTLIDEWLQRYYHLLPDLIREILDSNVQQVTAFLINSIQSVVSWFTGAIRFALLGTLGVVSSTVSLVIGIIVVPFWMFYMLNDQKNIAQNLSNLVPERYHADMQNLRVIFDRVLSSYLRGQLILCLFIGGMCTIGLFILGVKLSFLLGTIAGILEIVPTIGPFLGAIPAVLIALLTSPALAVKTAILYAVIQQIENLLLVPKVTKESVKLHPTITMLVLVAGSEVAGIWGILLAVPLTAIVRDLFWYVYVRTTPEGVTPDEAMALVIPDWPMGGAVRMPKPLRERLLVWREWLLARWCELPAELPRKWQALQKARAAKHVPPSNDGK